MTSLGLQAFDGLAKNRIFEGIESDLLDQIAPEVGVVSIPSWAVQPNEFHLQPRNRRSICQIR